MIPKVATHILHHTSRAAAAVQNQAIRNVLQIQTGQSQSSPSSRHGTGSSHWSNNGPGPGGSKFNPNHRFYAGYSGVGRAITQAPLPNSQDVTLVADETQEPATKPAMPLARRRRPRSHSVSLATRPRTERAETLGVLKSVQLRAMHAFSGSSAQHAVEESKAVPEHPGLARELSSATVSASMESLDLSMAPSVPNVTPPTHSATLPTDPAAPQTTAPPRFPQAERENRPSEVYFKLKEARDSRKAEVVAEAVAEFKMWAKNPTVHEYNMALEALFVTRRAGEPLHLLLELYNEMLSHSIPPNIRTYKMIIEALCLRDNEISRYIASLDKPFGAGPIAGREETEQTTRARVKQMRSENNFTSAMTLFEAFYGLKGNKNVPISTYLALLRTCSQHANLKAAIHVFNQLRKRPDTPTPPLAYLHLISILAKVGDLHRATATFEAFRKACTEGTLAWAPTPASRQEIKNAQIIQVQVYDKMIEAYLICGEQGTALALLEEMMDSPADPKTFTLADVPHPASSTFAEIITGFCQANDVSSALTWFEKLLAQPPTPTGEQVGIYGSRKEPGRPNRYAWRAILRKLSSEGMISEVNRLFKIGLDREKSSIVMGKEEATIVFNTNLEFCSQTQDSEKALECLDIARQLMKESMVQYTQTSNARLVELYVRHGGVEQAVELVEWNSKGHAKLFGTATDYQGSTREGTVSIFKNSLLRMTVTVMSGFGASLPWSMVNRLLNVLQEWQAQFPQQVSAQALGSYYMALKSGDAGNEFSNTAWDTLLSTAPTFAETVGAESATQVFVDLLAHMASTGAKLVDRSPSNVQYILATVVNTLGEAKMREVLSPIAPSIAEVVDLYYPAMDDAISQTAASEGELSQGTQDTLVDAPVVIDPNHSRYVDEWFHVKTSSDDKSRVTVHDGYARYLAGLEQNRYPIPTTFAHLITGFGRLGAVEKVTSLYNDAQRVIGALEKNKEWQTQSWFTIEDSMIIGFAHAGDLNAAHLHRVRVLEQGGAPSADAYGALIQYVKDTTDDTSSAMALFQESQTRGVKANIYLYNNIISKLAKARKADYALELFHQMKASHVIPSSITYGALIAACARVGDHHSAEQLFTEMVSQRNFKPRVPPYNTMMQLYTTTKPSRERALFYFDAMKTAGVRPTAHTYKLLIDAYGTIEPLDMASVHKVFRLLENDSNVPIQGSHWAAIINAWGCASKDLAKAIEVFDSIATHPKTLRSSPSPLPDAVCYEALINVLVTHRRADLITEYTARLQASGVHMTAYIANFLIKGHAVCGDLGKAREMFEGLADPPVGLAAPNNHVPHEGEKAQGSSSVDGVVYREPSTWETMIRAELGAGNRENAITLLDRLRQRQYPEAVYQRISGIMLDDSVAPWAAESVSSP